jgi:hypothetical protein
MRTRLTSAIFALLAIVLASAVMDAQSVKRSVAPAAQATNATPDLSGVWTAVRAPHPPAYDQHGFRETLPPESDQADFFTYRHSPYPMQPWAEEKFNYQKDPTNPYYQGRNEINPILTMCAPKGPTISWLDMYPFEIIQSPKRILLMFELNHDIRQVWMDGRPHPKDFGHNWMGHSIGHWEGDTLVIDTIGLNDLTWLDPAGHIHSNELHLIERLRRAGDKLSLNITFDDPKAFTMPWSARKDFELKPTWEIEEAPACGDDLLGRGVPLR